MVKVFQEKGLDVNHIWFPNFEIFYIRAGSGLEDLANPEYHENTAEVFLILSGKVRVVVAGQLYELGPGKQNI